MIRLRPEQLDAFMRASVDAFVDELTGALDLRLPAVETRELVSATIAAAVRCGFVTKDGIRGFVLRVRALGPGYHEHASVRDWLREPGLTENEKLAAVDARAEAIRTSVAGGRP